MNSDSANSNKRQLVFIFAAIIAIRIAFINSVTFVNPDSAIFLRSDFLILSQRLPFFHILAQTLAVTGVDLFLSGKLINAFFGGAAVFPLFSIVRNIGGSNKATLYVGAIYLLSPLPFVNQLLALSEGLFLFLFLIAVDGLIKLMRGGNWVFIFQLIFASGLAILTRAEGYVLLPLILTGAVYYFKNNGLSWDFPPVLLGLFPFLLLALWHFWICKNLGYLAEFAYSLSKFNFVNWAIKLLLNFAIIAFAAGPLVLILTFSGFKSLVKGDGKRFAFLFIYLVGAMLIGITTHWAFDLRFLIAPSILFIVFASIKAADMKRKWVVITFLAFQLTWFLLVGFIGLSGQTNAGRSISKMANRLPEFLEFEPSSFYSNEIASTGYYLKSEILPLPKTINDNSAVVILHSQFSVNIDQVIKALMEQYDETFIACYSGKGDSCKSCMDFLAGKNIVHLGIVPYSVALFVRPKGTLPILEQAYQEPDLDD